MELTREEVLHVAGLAKINVSEDDIKSYQESLGKLISEIDKINDIDTSSDDMMFSPCEKVVDLDSKLVNVPKNDLLKNVPDKKGNFIKVPVMINE